MTQFLCLLYQYIELKSHFYSDTLFLKSAGKVNRYLCQTFVNKFSKWKELFWSRFLMFSPSLAWFKGEIQCLIESNSLIMKRNALTQNKAQNVS